MKNTHNNKPIPAKVLKYMDLSDDTLASFADNSGENWIEFLDTAARMYKYSFDDQLLIYAQRPEITACAEFTLWSENYKRWIRGGSKGIALVENKGENAKLKYVYALEDTENTAHSKPVYIWKMKPEYTEEVTAKLAEKYDITRLRRTLEDIFIEASKNILSESDFYVTDIDGIKLGKTGIAGLEKFDRQAVENAISQVRLTSV